MLVKTCINHQQSPMSSKSQPKWGEGEEGRHQRETTAYTKRGMHRTKNKKKIKTFPILIVKYLITSVIICKVGNLFLYCFLRKTAGEVSPWSFFFNMPTMRVFFMGILSVIFRVEERTVKFYTGHFHRVISLYFRKESSNECFKISCTKAVHILPQIAHTATMFGIIVKQFTQTTDKLKYMYNR